MSDAIYRIALCDDEEEFLAEFEKQLIKCLRQMNINYEIHKYTSVQSFLKVVKKYASYYHLIVLDILMEEENGISAAKKIRDSGITASILFITCSKDYSLDGYSVFPIHYLLKPVISEELYQVIKKDYICNFKPHHILLPTNNKNIVIRVGEVIYVEIQNRDVSVVLDNGRYSYTGTLKQIREMLPSGIFIQCHKSFIINITKVMGINRNKIQGKVTLSMANGSVDISVGRTFFDDVRNYLDSYYREVE